MTSAAHAVPAPRPPAVDHFVVFRGATWADFQRFQELRGDRSAPRLTYRQGVLQIMSPSINHEAIKGTIGCLVEAWCLHRGVEFSTYGSWTIEDKEQDRGVEPDECYVFGEVDAPTRPDLAIEVVWTSGGIDKLDVYRGLGVREVWFWRDGALSVHLLRDGNYTEATASDVLPEIDLVQLASFIDRPTTSASIREYTAALSGEG